MKQKTLYDLAIQMSLDQQHECWCAVCVQKRQDADILLHAQSVMGLLFDCILEGVVTSDRFDELRRRYYAYANATQTSSRQDSETKPKQVSSEASIESSQKVDEVSNDKVP